MSGNSQRMELNYAVYLYIAGEWAREQIVFHCLGGALRYWLNEHSSKHVRIFDDRGTLHYEMSDFYYTNPQSTISIDQFHILENRVSQIRQRRTSLVQNILGDLAIEADLYFESSTDLDSYLTVHWEKEGF